MRTINYGPSRGLRLPSELEDEVETFRSELNLPDRAAAVRILLVLGLVHNDMEQFLNETTGTMRVPREWVNRSTVPPLERQKVPETS